MKQNNSNSFNVAKIGLLYRGLNAGAGWRRLVETQLSKLQHLGSIASANVTLERSHECTPQFRVSAILEVPGPDFHAEARDYTLRAALLKVVGNLRRQMQASRNRQQERRKNRTRLGFVGSPSLSSL